MLNMRRSATALEDYFTPPDYAERCARQADCAGFFEGIDLLVEPAAGAGALLDAIEPYRLQYGFEVVAFDIAPQRPDIRAQDFFEYEAPSDKRVGYFSNPPFGSQTRLLKRFLSKMCAESSKIACIGKGNVMLDGAVRRFDVIGRHWRRTSASYEEVKFSRGARKQPSFFCTYEHIGVDSQDALDYDRTMSEFANYATVDSDVRSQGDFYFYSQFAKSGVLKKSADGCNRRVVLAPGVDADWFADLWTRSIVRNKDVVREMHNIKAKDYFSKDEINLVETKRAFNAARQWAGSLSINEAVTKRAFNAGALVSKNDVCLSATAERFISNL